MAEVSFCDPINDFTFKWKIDGLDSTEIAGIKENSLRLPAGTFEAGKFVEVGLSLLNKELLTMASVSGSFFLEYLNYLLK